MTGAVDVARIARGIWKHPHADRAQIRAFQDERLRAVVAHAYANVPFYRELYQRHGVHPRDIKTSADLVKLPVIDKRLLRAAPVASTLARGQSAKRLISVRTSGSTGVPFEMRRTWLEQNIWHLFRLRAHGQFGRRPSDRLATLVRKRAVHKQDNKLLGKALARLGLGSRMVLDVRASPELNLADLLRFAPDIVHGYPNSLLHLGERIDGAARAMLHPRVIISGAEVLTPAMRARLRMLWSAPVYEIYGSHEFNVIAWECREAGGLHTCDDSLVVEVLQGDRPAAPGERGEPVITALHAYAMPFIRYRMGDTVTRGADTCSCGQPFGKIDTIQGRMLDYLRLPNGRWMHPHELIFALLDDGFTWVGRFQIVQEREDSIVLRIVPMAGASPGQITAFERRAAELVGSDVSVRIEIVPEIALDPGGKFRISRSLLESNYESFDWRGVTDKGSLPPSPG